MIRARVHRNRRPLLPFFHEGRPTSTSRSASTPRVSVNTAPVAPAPPVVPKAAPLPLNPEDKEKAKGIFGSIYRSSHKANLKVTPSVVRKEAYTPEQFATAWYQFCQIIPNHPDIHFIFKTIPTVQEGNKITLVTSNAVMQEKLTQLIPTLKKHLGNQLQNDTFQFEIELVEDNTPTASPEEKVKAMMAKNKNLKNLLESWKLSY